ncbi:hypothetical protein [Novosphingobium beihaiensis]|uniref:Uncharacterized protein n=1 Tax=Novosphingobium beihaiensis TaxID=2930389 RepID=A0ABT0BNT7_9SPHN|nr:hypothetical protein [Novosphingobium beihaiensis]MCJ2186615.1 hypothetical protein [Novosphingobium beihaiensis]
MTAHAKHTKQPKPDSPVPVALETPASGKNAGKICFFADCPEKIKYPTTGMRQLRSAEDGMVFCKWCQEDLESGYKRIKAPPPVTDVSDVQPYPEPRRHFALFKCHSRRDCPVFLKEQKSVAILPGETIEDSIMPYDTPLQAYDDGHWPCEVCEKDHGIPWL